MTDRINHITADTACDSPGPEACFAYQTDSEFFLIVDCARGLSAGAVAEEAVILAGSTIPGNFARPGCAGFS